MDYLEQLRLAALVKKPEIILKGMGPKVGFDRCSLIWKTLLKAGYTQVSRTPSGKDTFTETWHFGNR